MLAVQAKLIEGALPKDLVAAGGILVDARVAARISFKPGSGGTVEYSRVDEDATAHDGTPTSVASFTSIAVDWPFYWVGAVTANGQVAAV